MCGRGAFRFFCGGIGGWTIGCVTSSDAGLKSKISLVKENRFNSYTILIYLFSYKITEEGSLRNNPKNLFCRFSMQN